MITIDLCGSPFSIDDVDVDDREVVVDVNVNFDADVDVIVDDFLKMLIER